MRGSLAVVSIAVACVLGGCGSPAATDTPVSTAVVSHFRGVPRDLKIAHQAYRSNDPRPVAAWAPQGAVYVTTWSSSSCPKIPTVVVALHSDYLEVKTVDHDFYPGDNGCSADLGPTTSVVSLPTQIDDRRPLTVWIDGTITELPART